jgi:hypothetical protein
MGHAYEGTTADVIARFARLNHRSSSTTTNDDDESSSDVGGRPYFVTGADEHGEKIAKTAEVEGKAPIDICNKVCVCVLLYELVLFFVFDLLLLMLKCLSLQYRNNISNLSHPYFTFPLYFIYSTLLAFNVSINVYSYQMMIISVQPHHDINVRHKHSGYDVLPMMIYTWINIPDGTISRKKHSLLT